MYWASAIMTAHRVFTFDGVDTINITGGDYAETYFRSQN
jgi:hypothetical protein